MPKKNEEKPAEIIKMPDLDMLTKLRVIITSIFVMSTISFIILIIFPNDYRIWIISAALILISYIIIIVLMIHLWRIQNLER
jgi:hypothetical protein